MKFAYARVSTRKQSRDGNGLDEQITKLNAEGYDELVFEEFSGSTTKRPHLDTLIQRLQHGDTLIVTKLDRFARSKDGFREGRPPIDQKRKDFAVDLILNQHKTYREVVELTGLSKSTLIRAVNAYRVNIALQKSSSKG